ncbi:D-Ala-D-Ala carboxypeptidase family metallohydrolase [Sphingomonadaceae bacterium G21617-S1]|nr:D-Ala-D-Ala carboxypeptidase family metallohydrolase [Sphingomonadaceae bacterium G21617-S1]
MNLSDHFTLSELTRSDTAARYAIRNVPDAAGIDKLRNLCQRVLEPVRAHYGRAVVVNSGYRSPALNAKIPGSSNTSQHTLCEAVDFEVPGIANGTVAAWVRDNLDFDQLILEAYTPGDPSSGWVHVSWRAAGRRGRKGQGGVLTMQRRRDAAGKLRTVYLPGLVQA